MIASAFATQPDIVVTEGSLNAAGKRFAIVAARFNQFMVDKLIEGAVDALVRTGAKPSDIEVYRCPGALEIPGLARRIAEGKRFDGLIALGVVIRGATPHFDLVIGEAVAGVTRLAADGTLAVGCGVVAAESQEQAIERSGSKGGNRGFDAAMVAVEMADLYQSLAARKA